MADDGRAVRADGLAGVVLAAGAGVRLAPLTLERPKALCPVGGVPLVNLALDRLRPHAASLAANLHHGADLLDAVISADVHRSVEAPEALGTAGALGALRPWIDDRPVLVTNADAWFPSSLDLGAFMAGWDGERVRLLCLIDAARGDFGDLRYCGVALLPRAVVERLEPVPSGLYEVSWRAERAADRLDLVVTDSVYIDCGTPADYLAANLLASGGVSVVDPSAEVGERAEVMRSVLWDGATVAPGEVLVDAIRTPRRTVLVR